MAIETVTVHRGGQKVRINKADYDPEKDSLVEEEEPEAAVDERTDKAREADKLRAKAEDADAKAAKAEKAVEDDKPTPEGHVLIAGRDDQQAVQQASRDQTRKEQEAATEDKAAKAKEDQKRKGNR